VIDMIMGAAVGRLFSGGWLVVFRESVGVKMGVLNFLAGCFDG